MCVIPKTARTLRPRVLSSAARDLARNVPPLDSYSRPSSRNAIGRWNTTAPTKQKGAANKPPETPRTRTVLPHCVFHFRNPIRTLQHLSRLRAIRRAHNPIPLHHVDQVRSAPISHAQPSLNEGSRRLPNSSTSRAASSYIGSLSSSLALLPPTPLSRSSFGASRNCC